MAALMFWSIKKRRDKEKPSAIAPKIWPTERLEKLTNLKGLPSSLKGKSGNLVLEKSWDPFKRKKKF